MLSAAIEIEPVAHVAATPWNRKKLVHECLIALVAIGLGIESVAAGPFTDLVIFGDSLSDVGNTRQASFGIYPGQYYWNGRFSNGPVYVEALAIGLGLPPIVRSAAGGDSFAYGGAKTSGTGGFEGLFIRDIDEQVDQFLAERTAEPTALFVVFAGSNDLVGGQTNVSAALSNLMEDMGRLITAGARQLLVLNLPLLGYTPRYNDNPTTLATYNNRTQQFNSMLDTMLDVLERNQPALTLHRFDVAALFNQALADPAAFGFSNVSDAAAPGHAPGDTSYDTNQIADDPSEYMFWDDLHPTAAVHAILADGILDLFTLPGDYNEDGAVDAADYVLWRKNDRTQIGYDRWRAHFGQTTGTGSAAGPLTTVPEPATIVILLTGMLAISKLRRAAVSKSRAELRMCRLSTPSSRTGDYT